MGVLIMKNVQSKTRKARPSERQPAGKAALPSRRGAAAKAQAGRPKTAKKGDARTAGRKVATPKGLRSADKHARRTRAQPGKLFARTARQGGCACLLVAAERVNGKWDCLENVVEFSAAPGGRRGGGVTGRSWERTCQALAALGHASRARMLVKLLEGPATYRALQKVSKLKAGPLYHHVNQLRLAGLVLPKQRDLYELTRGGRNVMLVALGLPPLIRDQRRRPVE